MKAATLQMRCAGSTIDISVEGKQHGHLSLPCATARSALGTVQIPVCVIRNGEGPIVTLLAGARGDEFDGQIALHEFISTLKVEDIRGSLIIVPTMNPIAARERMRLSPVDYKNLDECFPGDETGSISEQMAALIFKTVVEPADLTIELQSGGRTSVITALAAVHFNEQNSALQKRNEEHMIAFGAPYSARLLPPHVGSLANAVNTLEKEFIAVQLGGGGSANTRSIEIAQTGCKNVLVQRGMLSNELILRSTRMLEVTSEKNYVTAPSTGLLEMCKDVGDEVYMGSPVAKIIEPGHTGTAAVVLKADRNGILMARHHGGHIEQGDCVAIVADEVQR